MTRFVLWVVDHPILAGSLIGALTIALAFQVPRLQIDTSAEGFMVERDPARQHYEEFKQRFEIGQLTMVVVKAEDVITPSTLRVIQQLSDALKAIEGVIRVESLTTVQQIRREGGSFTIEPLVAVVPTARADLERIRRDALGNRIFAGSIISPTARAAVINVYTRSSDPEFNRRFTRQVDQLIDAASIDGVTIYQLGTPFTKVVYAQSVRRDLLILIPISAAVVFLILFASLGTLQAVVIPIVTGLISVVWALGLMAVLELPLNILTSIVPPLLIGIGFTEDVFMLSEYYRLLEHGEEKLSAIRTMARKALLPISVTTATTVVGFGSAIATSITMLIQFGYASALGLTANFIVTLVMLPILLKVWPVHGRPGIWGGRSAHGAVARAMRWLGERSLRYRVPIAALSALLAAASLAGWYSLRVNTDYLSYFPERSVIRQRVRDVRDSLGGPVVFYIVVETGREGGLKDPDLLRRIAGLQETLAGTGVVDKTVSVADYVRAIHREMNGGDPAFDTVPDTTEEVARYLPRVKGQELAKLVDSDFSTASIVVRHSLTSSGEISALLGRIDEYVTQNFPGDVRVRHTGESILINRAADYMAINELTSFLLTFVIIAFVHALLFRSLRAALLSLIPNVMPILFTFGLMGLVGVPLNTGTAMIASIAIGIAVDDTVHFMVAYSRRLRASGDVKTAVLDTLATQGAPVISISLALAGGFSVLVFSSFVPVVHFGIFSATAMVIAMITELVLTPLVLYSIPWRPQTRMDA